jgi:methyltransferase (TIGR00027 family)
MDTDTMDVQNQLSEAARGAALLRALAAVDEREELRGHDFLAEIFLAVDRKSSFNDPVIKEWLTKNYFPDGVYEYSIALTAYFDHMVEQALRENIPQIVFLGAGYDSRPYRFSELAGETRIFELDDGDTQQRKRELLRLANIPIPKRLTYAALSFNRETLEDIMFKAGFDKDQRSLFIWEGSTYNLSSGDVDDTLRFIHANSPAGSTICFDYNILPAEMAEAGMSDEMKEIIPSAISSEHLQFGIEEKKIGAFLAERDFIIIEHLTAEEMERKYLTLNDGSLAGKVPARHCIAYAAVFG